MRTAPFIEIAGLIALGAGSRLIPHLPNMTALSAVALKSRARFGTIGIMIPLASLLLSDLVIGFYNWRLLLSVYASFALISVLGRFLPGASTIHIVSASALSSTLFFLITNTVVWASSIWYPHTTSGLLTCLVAGLPFYGAMLVSDLAASLLLFRAKIPTRLLRHRNARLTLQPLPSSHAPSRLYDSAARTRYTP